MIGVLTFCDLVRSGFYLGYSLLRTVRVRACWNRWLFLITLGVPVLASPVMGWLRGTPWVVGLFVSFTPLVLYGGFIGPPLSQLYRDYRCAPTLKVFDLGFVVGYSLVGVLTWLFPILPPEAGLVAFVLMGVLVTIFALIGGLFISDVFFIGLPLLVQTAHRWIKHHAERGRTLCEEDK